MATYANAASPLYNFYQRYLWGPSDFAAIQGTLVDQMRGSFAYLTKAATLSGGVISPNGANASVNVSAFVALGDDGYLHVVDSNTVAPIAAGDPTNIRFDLIVARKNQATGLTINRPTLPHDTVILTTLQKSQVVVIQGTPSASPVVPSKVAGDVILGYVTVPNGWVNTVNSGNIHQIENRDFAQLPTLKSVSAYSGPNEGDAAITGTGNAFGGNGTIGVKGTGRLSTGIGVLGTGAAAGVKGVAEAGSNGSGVVGVPDGTGAGVYGAAGSTGNSCGGKFETANASTYGLRALATNGIAASVEHSGSGSFTALNVLMGSGGDASSTGLSVGHLGTGTGIGVSHSGASGTALSVSGNSATAAFRVIAQSTPSGAHQIGHMYVTTAGVLKICTAAGTPGTFVSVGTQT